MSNSSDRGWRWIAMLGAVVLVMGLIAFQLDAKGSDTPQTVAQVASAEQAAPAPAPAPPTSSTLPPPEPTVSVPANSNVRSLTPEEMVLLEQRLTEDEVEEETETEEADAPAELPPPPEPTAAPATTPAPVVTPEPVVTAEATVEVTPEPTVEVTPEATATETPRSGGGGMPAGTTEEMWHELRECESGNNYTLAYGQYHGAYQFSPATWDWLAADYYPDLVGVLPSDASPADQTKMAYKLYEVSGKGQWPVCGQHFP